MECTHNLDFCYDTIHFVLPITNAITECTTCATTLFSAGEDFTGESVVELLFPSNMQSLSLSSVKIINDTIPELVTEQFSLQLSAPPGDVPYDIDAALTAVSIIDDDC